MQTFQVLGPKNTFSKTFFKETKTQIWTQSISKDSKLFSESVSFVSDISNVSDVKRTIASNVSEESKVSDISKVSNILNASKVSKVSDASEASNVSDNSKDNKYNSSYFLVKLGSPAYYALEEVQNELKKQV